MLISKKEHANKIDDEIVAEIRRSAFLVADFTEHRQNVYFETGFAIGLGLQVIWTCRKDHIEELHFDIRQYNCIDWETERDLAQRLQQRIEAMFGRPHRQELKANRHLTRRTLRITPLATSSATATGKHSPSSIARTSPADEPTASCSRAMRRGA